MIFPSIHSLHFNTVTQERSLIQACQFRSGIGYLVVMAPHTDGPGFLYTKLEAALGWARKYSLFPYPFVTACCGMEFMAVSCSHYDTDRFGAALPRFTPRQSDLLF